MIRDYLFKNKILLCKKKYLGPSINPPKNFSRKVYSIVKHFLELGYRFDSYRLKTLLILDNVELEEIINYHQIRIRTNSKINKFLDSYKPNHNLPKLDIISEEELYSAKSILLTLGLNFTEEESMFLDLIKEPVLFVRIKNSLLISRSILALFPTFKKSLNLSKLISASIIRNKKLILELLSEYILGVGMKATILEARKDNIKKYIKLSKRLKPGFYKEKYPEAYQFFNLLRTGYYKIYKSWYSELNDLYKEKKYLDIITKLSEKPEEFLQKYPGLLRRDLTQDELSLAFSIYLGINENIYKRIRNETHPRVKEFLIKKINKQYFSEEAKNMRNKKVWINPILRDLPLHLLKYLEIGSANRSNLLTSDNKINSTLPIYQSSYLNTNYESEVDSSKIRYILGKFTGIGVNKSNGEIRIDLLEGFYVRLESKIQPELISIYDQQKELIIRGGGSVVEDYQDSDIQISRNIKTNMKLFDINEKEGKEGVIFIAPDGKLRTLFSSPITGVLSTEIDPDFGYGFSCSKGIRSITANEFYVCEIVGDIHNDIKLLE